MMPTPKTHRFRRIVCGVDFSPHSARALRYAVLLSPGADAVVTAVHAADPMLSAAMPAGAAGFAQAAQQDLDRFVRHTLGDVAAARVLTTVVTGRPGAALIAEARRRRAEVIVLGTNGRRGVPRLFFGSTAQAVLRRFAGAVLVVPPRCKSPVPGWPTSVLAAIEPDAHRRAHMGAAAKVAEYFGAWLAVMPAAPLPRGATLPGLIIYPLPLAGRARMLRQGSTSYAFICASRAPVLVIRAGRRHGAAAVQRRAA